MAKQFISSYQGEADYTVGGIVYRVRTFAMQDGSHKADQWTTILAEVGTVRAKHYPEASRFPSAAVMAEFPGYVAARYDTANNYAVEYVDGVAPVVFINHLGWHEVALECLI